MHRGGLSISLPIATDRLLLRTKVDDDAQPLASYLSDPEVCRFLHQEPMDLEECRRHLYYWGSADEPWLMGRCLYLVIEFAGEHVGYLTLNRHGDRLELAEIGWVLHPKVHGKGIASEAARALMSSAFAAGAHRIDARPDPRNAPSVALCERLSMRREAWFRQDRYEDGVWCDTLVYAVLAEEWLRATG